MDYEVVPIAVMPPPQLDEDLVKRVAAVIRKSPTHTRLLLAGEIPHIIAHADSLPQAKTIMADLGRLGLAAIACTEAEMERVPPTLPAQTLEFSEQTVLFRDSAGGERRLAAGDVSLIINGQVESSREVKTTSSRFKFSWGRTLLMGGIPVFRRVKETTSEKSSQSQGFARLYSRNADEPGVELWQHDLNYAFLGAERAAASVVNFTILLQRLRQAFPEAVFDDRLARSLALTDWQDLELNCRLIYLFRAGVQ
jgi:hypothetical protein